jgi:DNA-binding transcriptional ArsR family regulator
MQIEIAVSPQFDFCYALADLASAAPQFTGWPGTNGDPAWLEEARSFGWVFWLGLPDLIDQQRPAATIEEFVQALDAVPPDQIVPRLHRSLVQQPTSRFANAQMRQWLHFIGLDEREPEPSWGSRWNEPMDAPLAVIEAFRPHFSRVWDHLQPALEDSAAHARQLLDRAGVAAAIDELDPSIIFDERAGMMRTVRGFKLPLDEISAVFLMPSAFNSRRFKTASEFEIPRSLYIPYLLEEVELPNGLRRTADFGIDIDPWLVCRAIGNPTRQSILQLIAERPRAAYELQQQLDLSKANVSHHIFQLREAGLINEKRVGRTVELSIRLQALRGLGRALTRELGPRRTP